jgi:hypothetical protein
MEVDGGKGKEGVEKEENREKGKKEGLPTREEYEEERKAQLEGILETIAPHFAQRYREHFWERATLQYEILERKEKDKVLAAQMKGLRAALESSNQ